MCRTFADVFLSTPLRHVSCIFICNLIQIMFQEGSHFAVETFDKRIFALISSISQQAALAAAIRRNVFTRHRQRGTDYSDFSNANLDPTDDCVYDQKVQRRGSQIALMEISHLFGSEIFTRVETIWLSMTKALSEQIDRSKEGKHCSRKRPLRKVECWKYFRIVHHICRHVFVISLSMRLVRIVSLSSNICRHCILSKW